MKENIKIDKKAETVSITITVAKRKMATDSVIQIRTRDVVNILNKQGILFRNECIEECTVSNEKKTSVHKGTWVFPLVFKEEKPKVQKKSQKTKNITKSVKPAVENTSETPVFTKRSTFVTKGLDKTATK